MPIQLNHSRRGLYTVSEYKSYRGEHVEVEDDTRILSIEPLPLEYEPIIYLKCLINGHQFPVRPELGERTLTYTDFKNRNLQTDPFPCPACGELDIRFKFCELEDQPRTWNDLNHRFIKEERRRIQHPHSRYYQDETIEGIARPFWEDYFAPGHTNHQDPFAEHEVDERRGQPGDGLWSDNVAITQALAEEGPIPEDVIWDGHGVYIVKHIGQDMPKFPEVDAKTGKYLKYKQNYDFYRAILYVITQYNV